MPSTAEQHASSAPTGEPKKNFSTLIKHLPPTESMDLCSFSMGFFCFATVPQGFFLTAGLGKLAVCFSLLMTLSFAFSLKVTHVI